jgi:glycosyltransferase involved in cell wall biosynthesis
MHNAYLVSSAIGERRIPKFGAAENTFGRAHYSWKIIADLYTRGLQAIGRSVAEVIAPDIYQNPIAREVAKVSDAVTHISAKPIEHLRPLFGSMNVASCGWEFPEFSQEAIGGDPRKNQILMLKQMDEVWCWSGFTSRNLRKLKVEARTLPPPVAYFSVEGASDIAEIRCVRLDTNAPPVSASLTLGSVLKENGTRPLFLSILAPYDLRKNLPNLIRGFMQSRASREGTLIVKLIVDNVVTTVNNINQILVDHFEISANHDNIIFCGAYLSEKQLNSLYNACEYYISAASAEGLNLPLIEAMQRKLIAISTDKSAMEDYITSEHAVVVQAKRSQTTGQMHSLAPHLETSHHLPSAAAICDAVNRALRIKTQERVQMAKRAGEAIERAYGLRTFEERISAFERGRGR